MPKKQYIKLKTHLIYYPIPVWYIYKALVIKCYIINNDLHLLHFKPELFINKFSIFIQYVVIINMVSSPELFCETQLAHC